MGILRGGGVGTIPRLHAEGNNQAGRKKLIMHKVGTDAGKEIRTQKNSSR